LSGESSNVPSAAWYLVYTKPQQERLAGENLARQGYEIYLPLLRKRVKRGRSYHFRDDPLFPRYIFIHLSERLDDWGPIRSTIGVTHLVRFGNRAAAIPDALIDELRARENEEGVCEIEEKALIPGERVQFIDGSLHGYEAIYKCTTSSDRVLVLMEIAGAYTKLTVPASTIERKSDE
jgi:transcriptional antiterminator RfaH